MRTKSTFWHRNRIWGFAFLSIVACQAMVAHAQTGFGIYLGPGIQTLSTKEPTIADPYRPRILPQLGVMATNRFRHGIVGRVGVGYDVAGTQYQIYPALDYTYQEYWIKGRVDYFKAMLGIGYCRDLNLKFVLAGFADLAYGIPLNARFKDVVDGRTVREVSSNAKAYSNYWGLNLGVSLTYSISNRLWVRFSPTLQTQFNPALRPSAPNFHFTGFVPRIEFGYDLPSKYKNLPGIKGKRSLYIDDI